jgi:hypothetical protein
MGLLELASLWEVAGPSNGEGGGAQQSELRPYGEGEDADASRRPEQGTLTLSQASGLARGNKREGSLWRRKTLKGAKVGGRDECPVNSYLTEGRHDDEKKYEFAVRVAGSSVGAG